MRRIMSVENKRDGLDGAGRLGWVELSKAGRTFQFEGRRLAKPLLAEMAEYRAGPSTRTSGTTSRNERRTRGGIGSR